MRIRRLRVTEQEGEDVENEDQESKDEEHEDQEGEDRAGEDVPSEGARLELVPRFPRIPRKRCQKPPLGSSGPLPQGRF